MAKVTIESVAGAQAKAEVARVAAEAAAAAYADARVAALVDSSPAALDTLNELAAALGDDQAFAATVNAAIAARLTEAASDARYFNKSKTPNVVFDGDSLTAGSGSSAGRSYPSQTVVGLDSRATHSNIGLSGATMQMILDRAAATVDPLLVTEGMNVVVLRAGTNDLFFSAGATPPEDVHADIVAYCNGRRAAGWKIVVTTITPRSDASTPANFETSRQTLNTLIRNNWTTYADALADIAADPLLGDAGDETNKQYYTDLVHHTDNGYRVSADIVRRALGRLGLVQSRPPIPVGPSLWLPAKVFDSSGGTATTSVDSFSNRAWQFPDGSTTHVSASVQLPQDWSLVNIDICWGNPTSAAGDCYWRLDRSEILDNVPYSVFGDSAFTTAPGYNAGRTKVTPLRTNMTLIGGRVYTVRVLREGANAADTLAGVSDMLGLMLRKVG